MKSTDLLLSIVIIELGILIYQIATFELVAVA